MKNRVKKILIFTLGGVIPAIFAGVIVHFFTFTEEMLLDEIRNFLDNQKREIYLVAYKLYLLAYILYPALISRRYKINGLWNVLAFSFFYIAVCLIFYLI